jgi:hypothetical protein
MSMTTKLRDITFSSFLYVTIAGHLIFAVPAIFGVLFLKLMDVKALFFIFVPIALISIPISAAFAWLIARGSNWQNSAAAIKASCGLPGRIYGVLFGGLLGFQLFGTAGGAILAVLFYLLAYGVTFPLGKFLLNKLIPDAVSQKG